MGSHTSTIAPVATSLLTSSLRPVSSVAPAPAVVSTVRETLTSIVLSTSTLLASPAAVTSRPPDISTILSMTTSTSVVVVTITSSAFPTTSVAAQTEVGAAPQGQGQLSLQGAQGTISSTSSGSKTTSKSTATALAASSDSGSSNANATIIQKQTKGPFAPQEAILGTIPTTTLDVPITAIFLVLFLLGAITHMGIYQLNSKRGHKFILSDLVFDFCMVRLVTTTMRIVWAFRPNNNSIVLAALIFENAGVTVLFAINVVFTQRILRAMTPIGWAPPVSAFFTLMIASVPFIIIYNITVLTISFFIIEGTGALAARVLLIIGAFWTTFLSIFPWIFVGLATIIPGPDTVENFGYGRFRTKIAILFASTSFLAVGAFVRLIAAIIVSPKDNPGILHGKPIFYITGFVFEILVVAFYAVVRVDLQFWIPNGASGPGSYSAKPAEEVSGLAGSGAELGRTESRASVASSTESFGMEKERAMMQANGRWQDQAVDRSNASRDQVRQAIYDLQLNAELVGQPVNAGDSELLVYAFKVRKDGQYGRPPSENLVPQLLSPPMMQRVSGLPRNPRANMRDMI